MVVHRLVDAGGKIQGLVLVDPKMMVALSYGT